MLMIDDQFLLISDKNHNYKTDENPLYLAMIRSFTKIALVDYNLRYCRVLN